ncbi:MAG: CYTH domain-containing protein [Candidatus Nitrosocosmicus sp.]
MNSESEVSLIILSDNLRSVIDKITDIKDIPDFELEHVSDVKINDTYFDSQSFILHKKKYALRIRNENDILQITLKGPPKYDGHNITRQEEEYEWSKDSFDKMCDHLKEIMDIDKKEVGKYFDKNPLKTLGHLGFREIHKHTNNRKVFHITKTDGSSKEVISELDIDNVIYHLKFGQNLFDISVINIELEKKGKTNDYQKITKTMINHLKERLGSDVTREWKCGKLNLGKGLEKLYKENELNDYINSKGYLKLNALDKIKEFVDKGII